MKVLLTTLLSFVLLLGSTSQPKTVSITVQVDGLKNKNGYVAIGLFDGYGDFPEGDGFASKYVEADGSSIEVTFENIEPGEYAVAVLHDENGNEEMDYNEYGMPQEGFAFSNNAMGQDGPPSFGDASFEVNSDKVVSIDMVYLSY